RIMVGFSVECSRGRREGAEGMHEHGPSMSPSCEQTTPSSLHSLQRSDIGHPQEVEQGICPRQPVLVHVGRYSVPLNLHGHLIAVLVPEELSHDLALGGGA